MSLDILCIIDPQGNYSRINPAVTRILGYSPSELIGQPFIKFVHADDQEGTLAQVERLANGDLIVDFETRCLCQDGSYKWLAWTAAPSNGWIYGAGHDITMIKDARASLRRTNEELERHVIERTSELSVANQKLKLEVSERRQTEIELQRAKTEADEANNAKSQFLSRMSHELRTPLNAILGFGQILEELDLEPLAKESVGYVLKGGRHLLDLINEVLDLARVESGFVEMSIEPIEIEALVRDACALVQPLAATNRITVSVIPTKQQPAYVMADATRLKQVLINLLANAVKYNREGGTVTVNWKTTPDKRILIEVRDSGIGLQADSLKRIFDPFERLNSGDSAVEGTGLGLSISQRLMEAMGGSIIATSVLGEGSMFSVDIAVAEPIEHSALNSAIDQKTMARNAGRSYSVLAIEDNPSNLRLLEVILLSRPDISLKSAMQGGTGFDLARHIEPDLILLDLNLPDVTGMTVLDLLQKTKETKDIPIIIVSADATPSQIDRFLNAGAHEYLTKPVDVPRLLSVIAKCLPEV